MTELEFLFVRVMSFIAVLCVVALSVACVVVSEAEQAPATFSVVSGITAREEYCLSAGGGKSVVGARMLSAADLSIAWRILFHASSLRCILFAARGFFSWRWVRKQSLAKQCALACVIMLSCLTI